MVRPVVLLDCDGVLCDFLRPAITTMNRVMGTNLQLENMKSWHLFDAFPERPSKEQQVECYNEWKKKGFCDSLELLPGALDGVKQLRKVAYVLIVTSPMGGRNWHHERSLWIERNFYMDRDRVIPTNAKKHVAGDVFVDDKTEHVTSWRACFPDGLAVRWRQVTNRFEDYDGITTESWKDLVEMVREKARTLPEVRRWTLPTT